MLIETIKDLSSDLRWCSWNIFSTQDHNLADIMHDESAAFSPCKGEITEEYCYCIMNALIWPEAYGKGHRPDLIVYDGGDMTLWWG